MPNPINCLRYGQILDKRALVQGTPKAKQPATH